ncbi:MAG: ThuA domain-containing protein, partial [Caldilineaceae bacterium]|nr:ThuA domain-containing protein [Caldilineaceae bacterium]
MIKLAVVTGAKAHDVIGFYELFRSFDGIDSYIQHIDDFAASPNAVRDAYDAVLFYFMMPGVATDEGLPGYCGRPRSALERLTQTGQGIVVLHHALLAYPQWAAWSDIVGIADRTLAAYSHDERIPLTIVDTEHPITADLADWTITDETYDMAAADATDDDEDDDDEDDEDDDNSHILLTTDHPDNARTVAWVRQVQESDVFCLQLGHDRQAWEDENFRRIL